MWYPVYKRGYIMAIKNKHKLWSMSPTTVKANTYTCTNQQARGITEPLQDSLMKSTKKLKKSAPFSYKLGPDKETNK